MSARDDYPITRVWSNNKLGQLIHMYYAMCAEIDDLRAKDSARPTASIRHSLTDEERVATAHLSVRPQLGPVAPDPAGNRRAS